MFYPPKEDSFLLAESVKSYVKNKDIKCLDVGTGSGIQSKNLISLGISKENITAVDINLNALKEAKNLGVKTIKSDLFSNLDEKFDLILFNPPYLPEDKHDKEIDTAGGKKGDEVIIRFIKELKNHLLNNGICLLLTSSLTPNKEWKDLAKSKGFKVRKIASKKLFFEELFVWEIESQ